MYLADKEIRKAVKSGEIIIRDFDESRLQPASYDILLSNKFIVSDNHSTAFVDPANGVFAKTREILIGPKDTFVLHPGVSVLGSSVDYFGSDKYLVHLSGKSSLARIGLVVHNTAGIVNPGHFLNITFELANLSHVPIILRPNMPIGQVLFSELTSIPEKDYKKVGRYHKKEWNSYIPPRISKKLKVDKKKKK